MPCGRKTLQSYGEKQTFPNFVCSLTFVNLVAALCGSLVCHLRGFLPESECKVTAFFPKNQIFWQEFYVIKHIFCRRVLAYLAYLADLQDGAQRRGRRTFLRGFHTTVLRTRRLAPKRHQTTIRHMGPGLPTSPLGRLGRYFADAKPLFTPVFAPAGRTRHWCVPAGFQWIRSKSRERSMGSGTRGAEAPSSDEGPADCAGDGDEACTRSAVIYGRESGERPSVRPFRVV